MRKLTLFIFPLILITVLFLVSVFIVSRDSGKGALQVNSSPSSKVYLNGEYIGDTPLCKCKVDEMIKSGDYNLKLVSKDEGFEDFEEIVRIAPSVLTVVERSFGKEGQGSGSIISLSPIDDEKLSPILVTSFPNKAEILLDNKKEGITPFQTEAITASDHEVTVRKESYKPKTLRVRTVAGYKLDIIVYLGIGVPSASDSAQADDVPQIRKVVITETPTGFLRVRESSSSAALQVGEVLPGEEYDLLEETDLWYKIKLNENVDGWISKTYAEIKPL